MGARVSVLLADGSRQTAEVSAGGGYLSQSSPRLVFGLGRAGWVKTVEVRWPDGESSTHDVQLGAARVTLRQP